MARKTVTLERFMQRNDWAPIGLVAAYAAYGAAGFALQRILAALATSGRIPMRDYQSALSGANLALGLAASLALLVLSVGAVAGTRGTRRTAMVFLLLSSPAPVLGALATTLLFQVLRLPAMAVGSVIASVFAMLVLVGPCLVALLVLSGCRRLRRWSRTLVLLAALALLAVGLFPTAVDVLALVVMPGNLALIPVMNVASVLLFARAPLVALGLALAYFPNRRDPVAAG